MPAIQLSPWTTKQNKQDWRILQTRNKCISPSWTNTFATGRKTHFAIPDKYFHNLIRNILQFSASVFVFFIFFVFVVCILCLYSSVFVFQYHDHVHELNAQILYVMCHVHNTNSEFFQFMSTKFWVLSSCTSTYF